MSTTAFPITYLFLDTEWADAQGVQLVSLALISADGERVFYAECDPLPSHPTSFVIKHVYPRLERGAKAKSNADMAASLGLFLSEVQSPHVLADYPNDLRLLHGVLSRLQRDPAVTAGVLKPPRFASTLMDRDPVTTKHLERWFSLHPELLARRHHALVDANALRMAWLVSTGRLDHDFNPLT